MPDPNPMAPTVPDVITTDHALRQAARLLLGAETVTDHSLMARLESLADSWVAVARTIDERDD